MSVSDWETMRPGMFWEAMNAHQREVEDNRIHVGELARGAALRLFNLQLKPKDRIKDPRDFWSMPWDSPKEDTEDAETTRLLQMSDDERRKEIDKFIARLNHGKRAEPEN